MAGRENTVRKGISHGKGSLTSPNVTGFSCVGGSCGVSRFKRAASGAGAAGRGLRLKGGVLLMRAI